ncbi:hypothetical protein [Endozoicomonas ascidiicola]|uniref:hypothetical protein n=1 Tax=Endozoicomonas ascidiicola TaxID=1698521 RepID=UPI00082B6DEA|nr:hypothetical protein [Endozoicomonas ascidiicola]
MFQMSFGLECPVFVNRLVKEAESIPNIAGSIAGSLGGAYAVGIFYATALWPIPAGAFAGGIAGNIAMSIVKRAVTLPCKVHKKLCPAQQEKSKSNTETDVVELSNLKSTSPDNNRVSSEPRAAIETDTLLQNSSKKTVHFEDQYPAEASGSKPSHAQQ